MELFNAQRSLVALITTTSLSPWGIPHYHIRNTTPEEKQRGCYRNRSTKWFTQHLTHLSDSLGLLPVKLICRLPPTWVSAGHQGVCYFCNQVSGGGLSSLDKPTQALSSFFPLSITVLDYLQRYNK